MTRILEWPNLHLLWPILGMAVITFMTRATPFFFRKFVEKNKVMTFIGCHLPSCIISILIIYCIVEGDSMKKSMLPIKEVIAMALTAFLHYIFKSFLVSIVGGTIFYLFIANYFL